MKKKENYFKCLRSTMLSLDGFINYNLNIVFYIFSWHFYIFIETHKKN